MYALITKIAAIHVLRAHAHVHKIVSSTSNGCEVIFLNGDLPHNLYDAT